MIAFKEIIAEVTGFNRNAFGQFEGADHFHDRDCGFNGVFGLTR
jgi:hypothetical protein